MRKIVLFVLLLRFFTFSDLLSQEGEPVLFRAGVIEDGEIERYVWRTDERELYNGPSSEFHYTELPNGSHTIYLRVQDDHGAWSEDFSTEITVNGRPRAWIEFISPDPALDTDMVLFMGNGTDDGMITTFTWYSDINNELYNGTRTRFFSASLSPCTHTITLMVQDNDGCWSDGATAIVRVHRPPEATIGSISPSPTLNTDTVLFEGEGVDDGTVVRYVWSSSIDGELYDGPNPSFNTSGLSIGEHFIFLKVQDNYGFWSGFPGATLTVNRYLPPNKAPSAAIEEPPSAKPSGTITLKAMAQDEDGSILRYVWRSSVDGVLYNGTKVEFNCSNLSVGTHILYLRVQDNNGSWSDEVSTTLEIQKVTDGGEKKDSNHLGLYILLTSLVLVFILLIIVTRLPDEYFRRTRSSSENVENTEQKEKTP